MEYVLGQIIKIFRMNIYLLYGREGVTNESRVSEIK